MTDAEEAEFWEAPLRHFTPAERAEIERGVEASKDAQADLKWRRTEEGK